MSNNNTSFLEGLGQNAATQAAGGIIGAGMGLLLEKHNDQRQIKQQQKLTDMQVMAQQQMGRFNYEQQMKMWHDTNYSAQMQEMEKAGINPALLYGMSGGGATTTGAPASGSGTGASAPSGGGEAMGLMMQQMQLGLMQAQRENIQADTKQKLESIPNIPLTGENIKASTTNLLQGVENQKAQQKLTEIQTELAKQLTEYNPMILENTASKGAAEVVTLWNQNYITNATKEDIIQKVKTEAANAILTGESIKQGIQVDKAQINKMAQDIAQGWSNINISKFKAQIEANFKGIGQIAGNLIEQIFNTIDTAQGQKNDQQPIKIK